MCEDDIVKEVVKFKCQRALILKSLRLQLGISAFRLAKRINKKVMDIYRIEGSKLITDEELEKFLTGLRLI